MSDRTSLVSVLLVRQSQQPVWDDRTWVMVNTDSHSQDFIILNVFNTLRPKQKWRPIYYHFQTHFFEWKKIYLIQISLKFVPKVPINNMPALVQIMAWCQPGDNPPSEPIMVSSLMHIYVTRPQWVNPESYYQSDVFLRFVWTCQESLIPLCKLEVHSTVLRKRSWD